MKTVLERLQHLCVGDVMHREVIEVLVNQSMTEAAKVLGEHEISGAPVVDETGRCVGMLSAVDFVRREARLGEIRYLTGCPTQAAEIRSESDESVFPYMSGAVQSVHAKVPLMEAARIMCQEHIHRVPVLDARGRAIGMVTAMDLVAAMVQAIEEHSEANHQRH
jgi:CBS-domain-containing membrane protein